MKINLNSVFKILITALLLSLLFLVYSCGAKKIDKTKTKEEVKIETKAEAVTAKTEDTNVKKTENTTIDDKNKTVTKKTTYEPIDPSKPASITEPDGTKTDLNNSKKTTEETTQQNNTKTDNSKKSDEIYKSELLELSESNSKSEAKKASEEIKVNRTAWSLWNLLWLIIPIGIIGIAWKNKTKIIGWFNGIWWI
jgi:DNA mismatch repair ATPase MutL